MHLLLSEKISSETSEFIEHLIEGNEEKLKKKKENGSLSEVNFYLLKEVELPYVSFLKKLNVWMTIKRLSLETDPINIGFS